MMFADKNAVGEYTDMSYAMYFGTADCVFVSEKYSVFISPLSNDPYYNYVSLKDCTLDEALDAREKFSKLHKKDLYIYITPASRIYGTKIPLEYFATDAWMFLADFNAIERLSNRASENDMTFEISGDKDKFIDNFRKVYDSPGSVYGIADEGEVESVGRFFDVPPPAGVKFFPVLFKKNDEITGHMMCCARGGYLQINSFGIVPRHRNGTALIQICKFCRQFAKEMNCPAIGCVTEKDSKNERLFQKLGFVTMFDGIYYKV